MQRYLSFMEQTALMRDLNQAVRQELGEGHYTTMVAMGWHGCPRPETMTSAGHPPPLWYRAARDEWSWLQTRRASEPGRPAGVPLGLLADVSYDQLVIKPQPGDLIVLYSDGVSEAMNPAGNELGLNAQRGRLAREQVHTPEAVFHAAQESQPGRTTGILPRSVVMGENPSNHVFVDFDVEGQDDLLGDPRTSPVGITLLHFDDGS